jgi:hypothetical protein
VQKAYVVSGTLRDDRTVTLDEPVPLGATKVRVTLEPIRQIQRPTYLEVLTDIRRRQDARGHRAPTRDEVDRSLRTERESWDD